MLTKYGSACFVHHNVFNVEHLSLQVMYVLSTLTCLQNATGHACVCYIINTDLSFPYLLCKDRSYSIGSTVINSEFKVKLDKCPI